MALAEGVVDLDDDGRERAVGAVRIPEADGLEREAEHARDAVQPDFAAGVRNANACEQLVQPGQAVGAAVAVVGVAEAEHRTPVARQGRIGLAAQRAHRQHQEAGRIGERVFHRRQAPMAHLAETDARAQGRRVGRHHAASRNAGAPVMGTCGRRWRARIRSAACCPDFRPSSWKP